MTYKYNRNFRFLWSKIIAFVVGAVAWLVGFVYIKNSGFYSIFSVADGLSVVSKDYSTFILSTVITGLVLYGGLLIGLSFLKGKARNVTSIVFACLLMCFSASMGTMVAYVGDRAFGVISNGFGLYVFLFCCVMVIVFSAIDLAGMSKEKRESIGNSYGNLNGNNGNFMNNPVPGGYNLNQFQDEKLTVTDQKGSMTCVGGEYVNFTFPINNGDIITIGKDPKSCAIVITQNNQYVSAVHCSVKFTNGRYELFDGSRNGVKVNGSEIPKQQWTTIASGSIFSLANTNNLFRVE